MIKPQKASLITELEKSISPSDNVTPCASGNHSASYSVDVMGYMRKVNVKGLNTFGDLCEMWWRMVLGSMPNAVRVDLVFDT